MNIEAGRRVRLKVELSADGKTIEKNVVDYLQGAGTMLPGLEAELLGLAAGDKKSGTIAAKDAFGSPAHRIAKNIPRGEFPDADKLEPGAKFLAKGQGGQDVMIHVQEIGDTEIKAELLHPLADKDIAYAVEILSVTDKPKPPPVPKAG